MELGPLEYAAVGGIGLLAGTLGGLAGIGGSMVMLPALHEVFGEPRPDIHHLYMAAAMSVNFVVAVPSALRHRRSGGVRPDLLRVLLPVTLASMAAGVLVSNVFAGERLRVLLAVFLLGYCLLNLLRMARRAPDKPAGDERGTAVRLTGVGAVTGFVGGLLGLGGGVVMVPLLQLLCRVSLRQAIGTSAATICFTSVVGAVLKLATLPEHGERASEALLLALVLAPTAIVGARLGAALTHRLHIQIVRAVITVLVMIAALRLGGIL